MVAEKKINFNSIEAKWQKKWEEKKIFEAKEDVKKKKFYVLEMFPYPSGAGLHMGHALNYTLGDIYARFKRLQGFNVLYPMGYDSLGLPAENAAIRAGIHPKSYTEKTINNFTKQQKALGLSYDWSRKIVTSEPDYYRWDQWIFLQMLKKGIAFRKKAAANWCFKCNSVLANEQVHKGKCWRHEDTNVEIKHLEQWFFRITDYAEELNNFDKLEKWPEIIKKLQKNWIGKSYGAEIFFEINKEKWPVFTTRPDTIYGVTFMVISAQHPKLMELVSKEYKSSVEKFLKKISSVSEKDFEDLEKEGVFTGSYTINPLTKKKIPVYAGNFVLSEYGSGMVMAVPAHDQRDFEFAKKYKIPIKVVIRGKETREDRVYTGEGELVNSGEFNGMNNEKAKEEIVKSLQKKNLGKKTINYKLRDWLISRQRYWGAPIPIIYCDKCGIVPVLEKDLPVALPEKVKFGKGNPLETNFEFVNVKCPKCKRNAKRETDTMDTFVNSSWYYLRYCDSKNNKSIFDGKRVKYWCPVDLYIGGKEHATMHLIYIRFYTKFLRDLGLIGLDEPALKLFNQGYLYGEDGRKMSKSYENVIEPLETIKKYSADALRFYLVSVSAPESDFNWSISGIESVQKFISKIVKNFDEIKIGKSSKKVESKVNKAIKEVTDYIESIKYNLAIIKIRSLFDCIFQEKEISKKDIENCLILLHLICPHITEELWEKLGNKKILSLSKWPKSDEKKINYEFEKQEQAIDKLVSDISRIMGFVEGKKKKIYIYVLPNEKQVFADNIENIKKRTLLDAEIFAVNEKNKYDPENKSKNVKPGRPGIYLE